MTVAAPHTPEVICWALEHGWDGKPRVDADELIRTRKRKPRAVREPLKRPKLAAGRRRLGHITNNATEYPATPAVEPNHQSYIEGVIWPPQSPAEQLAALARRDASRTRLWASRTALTGVSTFSRARVCGQRVKGDHVELLGDDQGRFTIEGLYLCGLTKVCPYCAGNDQRDRVSYVERCLEAAHNLGLPVSLLTLTMRHDRGQSLADLWDALSPAWAAANRQLRKDPDHVGFYRTVDITHGANGWHIHIHALVFTASPGGLSEPLSRAAFSSWSRALVAKGLAAPDADSGGLDCRLLDLSKPGIASYLAKIQSTSATRSTALEMVSTTTKHARSSNRNTWQILYDIATTATPGDKGLWGEWERASKGRRIIAQTKDLATLLDISVPEAETEAEPAKVILARIDGKTWGALCKKPDGVPGLLRAAERGYALGDYRKGLTTYLQSLKLPPPRYRSLE